MTGRYRFWSDTNQRHFEEILSYRGVPYRLSENDMYTVVVDQTTDWIIDAARSLGADCN